MTAIVGIECNGGCKTTITQYTYGQVSTTPVREHAKKNGWHKLYVDGEAHDICPDCWKEGKR
jgi:hypothetical protein